MERICVQVFSRNERRQENKKTIGNSFDSVGPYVRSSNPVMSKIFIKNHLQLTVENTKKKKEGHLKIREKQNWFRQKSIPAVERIFEHASLSSFTFPVAMVTLVGGGRGSTPPGQRSLKLASIQNPHARNLHKQFAAFERSSELLHTFGLSSAR